VGIGLRFKVEVINLFCGLWVVFVGGLFPYNLML